MWRSNVSFTAIYWAIALISAVVIGLWAGTALPPRVVAAQDQRVRSSGLVYGNQQVSQVVAVPRSGLSAIQFWLLAHQRDSEGIVILRVTTPERPDEELALIHIPLADLPSQPPVTFELPTFTQAATPVLLFTLQAPELDRTHAIAVLGGDNTYGEGLLLVNSSMRPAEDLSFRAFINEHRGDALLPLSRVAQGRPGLFGQPAFYAGMLWIGFSAYLWAFFTLINWIAYQRAERATATSPYITRRLTDT